MENLAFEIKPDDFPREARYRYAVNSALKLADGREYPLMLSSLFPDTNWKIATYSELAAKQNVSVRVISETLGSSDGACCLDNGRYFILYNDAKSVSYGRRRFTIAHEIGHIVLGHLKLRRHRNDAEYQVLEREANTFARNLLMPVPFQIDWQDIGAVADFFKVSRTAAWTRLQFLNRDLRLIELI